MAPGALCATLQGELGRLYEGWREALLQCVAHAEAFIDFGEDDDIGGDVLDDGACYLVSIE
jgi:tRNA modification GTPase